MIAINDCRVLCLFNTVVIWWVAISQTDEVLLLLSALQRELSKFRQEARNLLGVKVNL